MAEEARIISEENSKIDKIEIIKRDIRKKVFDAASRGDYKCIVQFSYQYMNKIKEWLYKEGFYHNFQLAHDVIELSW